MAPNLARSDDLLPEKASSGVHVSTAAPGLDQGLAAIAPLTLPSPLLVSH
jgi:hypothetical protein